MNDDVILPGELAALLMFLFTPPLLLGLVAQAWFLFGRVTRSRAYRSLAVTALLTISITFALWLLTARFIPHRLGFDVIQLWHHSVPVLPLSFLVVAVVAPAVSCFAARHGQA